MSTTTYPEPQTAPRKKTELQALIGLAGDNRDMAQNITGRLRELVDRLKGPTPTEVETAKQPECPGALGELEYTLSVTGQNLRDMQESLTTLEGAV